MYIDTHTPPHTLDIHNTSSTSNIFIDVSREPDREIM